MAKQTFTTGQVLTAAQMTSLQQTAMGGGSATTKTASYVLVAADAGTTVTMTSASATTITVNTALFAAGDTVYIQNLGAGVSTITAGTATVNTSATLALAQYEGGQLYFNSTSAAIFIKGAGAAASSGGMTLINTGGTTLTGASVTISSIPSTYNDLLIIIRNSRIVTDGGDPGVRINGDSTASRHARYLAFSGSAAFNNTQWPLINQQDNGASSSLIALRIPDYANTTTWKIGSSFGVANDPTTTTSASYLQGMFAYNQTGAISSLEFIGDGGWTSGTVFVYGVK